MKYFIKIAVLSLFLVSAFQNLSQAKEVVAVLNDNFQPLNVTYILYPGASNLIAQDIVNRINLNDRIKAIPVCNSVETLKQNNILQQGETLIKEYKFTYNINYPALRKVADRLGVNYILLITSGFDIQSSFLKETIWNKLNVPGLDSVNPQYRMISRITLVDPVNEFIVFQKTYNKFIASQEFDLANIAYSPNYAQMSKIKKYTEELANEVTPLVETQIVPELMPPKTTFIEQVSSKLFKKDAIPTTENIKILPNPGLKLYNYSTNSTENL